MPPKASKLTKPKKGKSKAKAKSTGPSERSLAIAAQCNAEVICDFDTMVSATFGERCGTAVNMFALERINDIQEAECGDLDDRDAFPSEEYLLLEDKLHPKSTKRAINSKGSKTAKPKKSKLPRKKGQKAPEPEPEPEPEAEESDVEEEESKTPVKKVKARKNVTQVQKGAKNWLLFLANRFMYEIFSTTGGKNLTSDDDFAEFVLGNVTRDFSTHMSKVIVSAVQLYGHTVRNMSDHKLQSYMNNACDPWFDGRSALSNMISRYIVTYLKLLGSTLGTQLWHKKGAITPSHIEAAMRLLNVGADAYLVEQGVCEDGGFNYGLHTGILKQARNFDLALNPPVSDEVKEARAAKRAATKAAREAKEAAGGDDEAKEEEAGSGDDEAKEEEEEEEEEDDATNSDAEVEDDDDATNSDAEVEDDDDDNDNDDDDDDDEEEEEEEEAPKPRKPVKKLNRKK